MSGQDKSPMLSVAEFAARVGRAERQVRRLVNRGEIRTTTEEINGRTVVRISEEEAARFLIDGPTVSVGPVSPDPGPDPVAQPSRPPFDGPDSRSGPSPFDEDPNERSFPDGEPVEASWEELSGPSGQPTVPVSGPERPQPASQVITASEILTRYEAAAVRLGWVEGQLEMTRKMLGDGGQQLEAMRQQADELRRRLDSEAEARRQAETRAAAMQTRLEALEAQTKRSWLQRIFQPT